MGADIWTYTEQCHLDGTWRYLEWDPNAPYRGPFDMRHYVKFGFLAGVRYRDITPIVLPRGLPDDISGHVRNELKDYIHTPSWVTVAELVAADYDQAINVYGETGTLREFLGTEYFADLDRLTRLDLVLPTRVVFWFDS